jgi:maltose alpha-D-glucosyltransferase/alpha-amylase
LGKDPLWYKDAIIYEVHVRAFLDSNADGIGDLRGLTAKLDYLRDLGVTAIWLLPFYPSPLRDDGYDIADYSSINPIYGTLKDFRVLLDEAHARNLRVITELVVNHTSDQHPWFQRSRRAPPDSVWRNFYVWSDNPNRYREARVIFRDFEPSNWTWDPIAQAYYWHRFYSHQPDLNYDNPQVHKKITRVLDYWLDLGVDGLRLDAVPYLYEREGTSCENLPETHGFLKTLRRHVDEKYGDRMLLAEANQWPEDAVSYFGSGRGDECHMAFHFPLMPRIFMAIRMEDSVPIVDILEQTPSIPETSQWALFLRNHDELTLEMVTDEERDYMYRVYANDAKARINLGIRRRLAPLLGNDRKRIELLHLLLLSYPGTPVLYYGDELGMGDNVFLGDRNGVRTPMQWSSDRNAGFSRSTPHALYLPIIQDPEYHYETVNVEAQQRNPNSLWWWMKRVLTLRKRYQAFGRGSIHFLKPDNRRILAFVRRYQNEVILVIANLSRFPQPAKLDLSEFKNSVPMELFGGTEFPAITETPYSVTLTPHAVFWFALEARGGRVGTALGSHACERISVPESWTDVFAANAPTPLEPCLVAYLKSQRWFSGNGSEIKSAQIRDAVKLPLRSDEALLLVVQIDYQEVEPEEYLLPVAFVGSTERERIAQVSPGHTLAQLHLEAGNADGILFEAFADPQFNRSLFETIVRRRSINGAAGELLAVSNPGLRAEVARRDGLQRDPTLATTPHNNTSIFFDERYFLKLFRRVEPGINPGLELERFLSQRQFPNVPRVLGSLEYVQNDGERFTVGMLSQFVENAKDAFEFTSETVSRYWERVHANRAELPLDPTARDSLLSLVDKEVPEAVLGLLGSYLELARLLGQRTGELHLTLASEQEDPNFAPEPLTPFYQRSLYQSMRNLAVRNVGVLRRSLNVVPEPDRPLAEQVISLEGTLVKGFRALYESATIPGKRLRCHGDLHLGQVLYTGKDFIFIDFEGQPSQPLGQRRIKRSCLRDVASMIRSFDYVVQAALYREIELGIFHERDLVPLEPWGRFWSHWISGVYLKAYLRALSGTDLLPSAKPQLEILLNAHLIEKALDEIRYELTHRPNWLKIPLNAILRLVETPSPV